MERVDPALLCLGEMEKHRGSPADRIFAYLSLSSSPINVEGDIGGRKMIDCLGLEIYRIPEEMVAAYRFPTQQTRIGFLSRSRLALF